MVGVETLYCAKVYAMKGGGGVLNQRKCLRIIVLIFVQMPRAERISFKGQATLCELTFTRDCHHQHCIVYGIPKGGRGESYIAQ